MNEEDIFSSAIEKKTPEERDAYLDGACAGDAELKARVEALIEAHENPDSFLSSPIADPVETIDYSPVREGPGTMIGKYKLLQEIGEGGMGVVFMAEQTEPVKRRVALKIIKPGMDTKQVIARFEAERQALAMMDHPNIAKVLDAGTTDSGRPYFVMELVKGVSITKYCDEHHMTPRERLRLFISVCAAVQHAHQKGIIHRDLKPSNVLVARYDGKPVAKVIDFGVAKATGQQLTEKTLFTRYGQVVGTLEYMSPEQAEFNQQDIDTRSDIYSLGILLYQLLTGTTPFDPERLRSGAWNEVMQIIREEEPPRPSVRLSSAEGTPSITAQNCGTEAGKLLALLRGDLDWLVMKALAKERERRYETASALAADIERYLDGDAIEARPPSAWYRFRKTAARHRVALGTTAIVVLALLAGLTVSIWQRSIAVAEREAAITAKEEAVAATKDADAQREAAERHRRLLQTETQIKQQTILDLSYTLYGQGVNDALSGNAAKADRAATRLREIGSEALAERLQALVFIQQRNAEEAVRILEPAVAREPDDFSLRALLTIAYDGAGDIDSYFLSHDILRNLEPKTAVECLFAAKAYVADPRKGLEFATMAFNEQRTPLTLLWRGRSQADYAMQAGLPDLIDEALADVDAASRLLGNDGIAPGTRLGAYLLAAHTCRAAGIVDYSQYLKAVAETAERIECRSRIEPWMRLYLSEFHYARGDLDAAWQLYESVPDADWSDYHVFYYQALVTERGRNGEQLERVRRLHSGPFSDSGRAYALAAVGNLDESSAISKAVLDRSKTLNSLLLGLDGLHMTGRSDAAAEIAEKHLKSLRGTGRYSWTPWGSESLLRFHAGQIDVEELLASAEASTYPKKYLAYAHWTAAVKNLGSDDVKHAKVHLQRAKDQSVFYLGHYWWSRALLQRLEKTEAWPPGPQAPREP